MGLYYIHMHFEEIFSLMVMLPGAMAVVIRPDPVRHHFRSSRVSVLSRARLLSLSLSLPVAQLKITARGSSSSVSRNHPCRGKQQQQRKGQTPCWELLFNTSWYHSTYHTQAQASSIPSNERTNADIIIGGDVYYKRFTVHPAVGFDVWNIIDLFFFFLFLLFFFPRCGISTWKHLCVIFFLFLSRRRSQHLHGPLADRKKAKTGKIKKLFLGNFCS